MSIGYRCSSSAAWRSSRSPPVRCLQWTCAEELQVSISERYAGERDRSRFWSMPTGGARCVEQATPHRGRSSLLLRQGLGRASSSSLYPLPTPADSSAVERAGVEGRRCGTGRIVQAGAASSAGNLLERTIWLAACKINLFLLIRAANFEIANTHILACLID
jgi:hypothetical protein